jgi:tellurite resistance protein
MWHGTSHHFDFANPLFAAAFTATNSKKVAYADRDIEQAAALLTSPVPSNVAAAPAGSIHRPPLSSVNSEGPSSGAPARAVAPSSFAQSYARSRLSTLQFVGHDESVDVGHFVLKSPFVYVDTNDRTPEASAIVRSAAVGKPDLATDLPYWPSYSNADPAQRARYLQWLATGKNDPSISLGYVFLYFYGLERRALVDSADQGFVAAELNRLFKVYSHSRSFRNYTGAFRGFLLMSSIGTDARSWSELLLHNLDSPAEQRAALAWHAANDEPAGHGLARAIAAASPDATRGVVVKRAASEMAELFEIRFRNEFGEGARLEQGPLETVCYRAASATLQTTGAITKTVASVANARQLEATFVKLWNGCAQDLKKVGSAKRDGERELTGQAWAALPKELQEQYEHPDSDKWNTAIQKLKANDGIRLMSAKQLVALAGIRCGERATAAQLRTAAETAKALQYAIEPDPRVTGKGMLATAKVAVWPTDDATPPAAKLWIPVSIMTALAMNVAMADGKYQAKEGEAVVRLVEEMFTLDEQLRQRVTALRMVLAKSPSRVATLAKKLTESRSKRELEQVGRVLVVIAAVDGVISDGEHKSLKSLYKALGLSPSILAGALAKSGAKLASDRLVVAAAAEIDAAGELLPGQTPQARAGLDPEAIAALLAETREVAAMLAQVFERDDEDDDAGGQSTTTEPGDPIDDEEPATAAAESGEAFDGLDRRYHAVLQGLLAKQTWTKAEARSLVAEHSLMMGAVLETINSWSEQQYGDFLIVDEADWSIDQHIAKELDK